MNGPCMVLCCRQWRVLKLKNRKAISVFDRLGSDDVDDARRFTLKMRTNFLPYQQFITLLYWRRSRYYIRQFLINGVDSRPGCDIHSPEKLGFVCIYRMQRQWRRDGGGDFLRKIPYHGACKKVGVKVLKREVLDQIILYISRDQYLQSVFY